MGIFRGVRYEHAYLVDSVLALRHGNVGGKQPRKSFVRFGFEDGHTLLSLRKFRSIDPDIRSVGRSLDHFLHFHFELFCERHQDFAASRAYFPLEHPPVFAVTQKRLLEAVLFLRGEPAFPELWSLIQLVVRKLDRTLALRWIVGLGVCQLLLVHLILLDSENLLLQRLARLARDGPFYRGRKIILYRIDTFYARHTIDPQLRFSVKVHK